MTALPDGGTDVRIPQLKLRQSRTPCAEHVPLGSWFVTSDRDGHGASREVVLLDAREQRSVVMPLEGGEAAEGLARRIRAKTGMAVPIEWRGPVCYSRDRRLPVARPGIPPLATRCSACPMSRWRTGEDGRRTQDCAESYRLLFFDLALAMPVVFHARGSAFRPVRDLLTDLEAAGLREARPTFGFVVSLEARAVETSFASYFVPVFGRPEPVEDPARVAQYAAARAALAHVPAEES